MTTAATRSGLIDIGSTKLYYELHGSGPAMLLISGGADDAGQWAHVAPVLANEFTVVTYDRRGLSRSPRPEGWTATSVLEQADDAAALLRGLGRAPATVVGHSGGAAIACGLVMRHRDVVRRALIYEAPLLAVVPDGDRIVAGMRAAIDQAFAEGGAHRAMEMFIRANAGDEAFEHWIESADRASRERVLNNGAVFFAIELPALATFTPDRAGIRASGVPLTVAVGEESRGTWLEAASAWLAEGTGAELVTLPGGHAGFDTHPTEFIDLVRRIAR